VRFVALVEDVLAVPGESLLRVAQVEAEGGAEVLGDYELLLQPGRIYASADVVPTV
jgi:hypothetical protein